MPNRIIKESIHTSESVNAMTDFQFRLWVNLITYVDDYGRGDARPAVIKGTCFPLRERITNKDIEAALNALAGTGCVSLYEVDGKPYLYFPNWGSHQNVRNQKSKFPPPDSNCNQLKSIASKCSRNPIQSESESEYESEYESESEKDADASCAERCETHPSAPETTPQSTPSEFNIPLQDGTGYNVPLEDIEQYRNLYPGVDVEQALRNMIGWSMTAGANRKTRKGVKRFITSWLIREQDKSGRKGGGNVGFNRESAGESPRRLAGETIV